MFRNITSICMIIGILTVPAFARVFFSGSNPMMTVFAFPQDILLIQNDFAYTMHSYMRQPWWGDIDQVDLRPSTSYLLTGERIGSKSVNNYFGHDGNVYNWKNSLGFTKTISERFKTRFDLDYTYMPFRNYANGILTDSLGTVLQFDYAEKHSNHDYYLTSYFATYYKKIPVGFKIGFGRVSATTPVLDFKVKVADTSYTVNRHYWAWSTLRGSKVFEGFEGEDHAQTQNSYTSGGVNRFDLQAAATLSRLKAGARFRKTSGELDLYSWKYDSTDANQSESEVLRKGNYTNNEILKIGESTIRLYGNYNWLKEKNFLFSTLVLTRYTVNDSNPVLRDNKNASSGYDRQARTFVFQVNPNVSIFPWEYKHTYIDLAILCNYSHTSYDHTQNQWVNGGFKDTYISSRFSDIEDYSWHDFSYARQNFFEIAFDANPSFPVYGSRTQSVAFSTSLLLWTRFKWMNKYYGQPGSDFEIQNIRKSYEREVWLNSVLNIVYRKNENIYRLFFGQPLTYSLLPVTSVYDKSGKHLIERVRHENMWVSQSGAQAGIFMSVPLQSITQYTRSIVKGR